MTRCPVCLDVFPKPFQIRPQPPTAGGRVLSLDGGGVKGIIELEILQQLCDLVGGDLSVDNLFDMVVGTSIGKLISRIVVILNSAKTKQAVSLHSVLLFAVGTWLHARQNLPLIAGRFLLLSSQFLLEPGIL